MHKNLKTAGLLISLFFMLAACGLDDIVYLAPPREDHKPNTATSDDQKYFDFTGSDTENKRIAASYFRGFDIYYRIYDTKQTCEDETHAINEYNKSSGYNAARYLIETKKYARLITEGSLNTPLIEAQAADQKVSIRLKTYGSALEAEMRVDGASFGIPLRSNKKSFDAIDAGDSDVLDSKPNPPATTWYAALYAVTYGFDGSIGLYSSLCPLGYIELP